MVTDHAGKTNILFNRFQGLMVTPFSNSTKLNWEPLGLPRRDLQHLDAPFIEKELKTVVNKVHEENAPRPDGFTEAFLRGVG